LAWWRARFERAGVPYQLHEDYAGRAALHFADPEGQLLGLVAAGPFTPYQHWEANVASPAQALQALQMVTLGVHEVAPNVDYLVDIFGYQVVQSFQSGAENEGECVALALEGVEVGGELLVVQRTDAEPGLRGTGSVHHVALTVDPADSIEAWHTRLVATGLKVSEIMRRYYFDSVYVRIPGGTLFELATATGPGLAADEAVATLGETLTLPPFLEGRRAEIEAKLEPFVLTLPRKI
jgi:glyoxalase family protein